MNFFCRVFGHRWSTVWSSKGSETFDMVVCERCGEAGWRT